MSVVAGSPADDFKHELYSNTPDSFRLESKYVGHFEKYADWPQ
jgi:hypothetical protein